MVFEDVGRKEFNRKSILRKSYILSINKNHEDFWETID
jgi:hypothetical protein